MRRLLPLLFVGCATASSAPTTDSAPVVVELFTSQGCSSCPPAEALLDKLARDGKVAGRTVLPLAFHVDYWDDLGWADPFASPAWSERQREYAHALRDDRVYTPEMVVAGRVGFVGSDALRAAKAIAAAPAQTKLTATATWDASHLRIEASAPADAGLLVAIYQDGTRTKVPRGENRGETLANDRVVRKLVRLAEPGKSGKQTIDVDAAWTGAVVFAQRADSAIIGSALFTR
jgi:hypothetical protein